MSWSAGPARLRVPCTDQPKARGKNILADAWKKVQQSTRDTLRPVFLHPCRHTCISPTFSHTRILHLLPLKVPVVITHASGLKPATFARATPSDLVHTCRTCMQAYNSKTVETKTEFEMVMKDRELVTRYKTDIDNTVAGVVNQTQQMLPVFETDSNGMLMMQRTINKTVWNRTADEP